MARKMATKTTTKVLRPLNGKEICKTKQCFVHISAITVYCFSFLVYNNICSQMSSLKFAFIFRGFFTSHSCYIGIWGRYLETGNGGMETGTEWCEWKEPKINNTLTVNKSHHQPMAPFLLFSQSKMYSVCLQSLSKQFFYIQNADQSALKKTVFENILLPEKNLYSNNMNLNLICLKLIRKF